MLLKFLHLVSLFFLLIFLLGFLCSAFFIDSQVFSFSFRFCGASQHHG